MTQPQFSPQFRADLLSLLSWRRDVRRFAPKVLSDETLERLLRIASLAPSVGLSQPWRFVTVSSQARRTQIATCFAQSNAEALDAQAGDRAAAYASLKLAGLDEAPQHVAVFADPTTEQGYGLGRETMPETIAYSAVLAIHTLWLAARAERIGMGWISILDPRRVAEILDVPSEWIFIGYLCIGYPLQADDVPELERAGWEQRHPSTILRR
jgi:5,6-dimethylbenzimidazole synthase